MSRKLKVLISAYACEPDKGSEPEVGWQWALQMARFHDVTVLTRANNRASIEQGLGQLRGQRPLPEFVYHDESPFLLYIKRRFGATHLYYLLWQRSARERLARLQEEHRFDLFHHATFAAFRYPAAIWGHGVPCIWGPVGGIESIPLSLFPWSHPKSLLREIVRNSHNLIQASPFHIVPKRAAASTTVLASTSEMQQTFAKFGFTVMRMPSIGLSASALPYRTHTSAEAPLKLLFAGNITTLKGVDLALRALAAAQTSATLTLFGDGSYLPAARRLVCKLGLQDRVFFRGRLPRHEVLKLYHEFDVFIFPSLHDTGGYAVIEAMFNELPVICLDLGGPATSVREHCGIKVALGRRSSVIAGVAAAIRHYDQDRTRIARDGKAAREVVLQDYDWDRKGEHMNTVYHQAFALSAQKDRQRTDAKAYTGIGQMTAMLHRMFSFKGMAVWLFVLFLIGSLGFASLGYLKQQASTIVNDTLPGLSYAGQANAYLADAYRTLLFIVTEDTAQRAEIRKQMETRNQRTSGYLEKYKTSIYSEVDRDNFRTVLQLREQYIETRDHVMALASAGKKEDALASFHQNLIPLQARVKQAGEKLLDYNMGQSETRGLSIMRICTVTQAAVAFFSILIFILGFFVGFSK